VEASIVPLAVNALRLLVYLIFGLLIAQNLGYSIAGIVASLGLGGAALALASQDTLANLFGSFMILVDKPFAVGDWIKGSGFEGVVEQIGFRSTRIRTFGKTIENIPNNMLANVKVENMDRRKDPGLNVRRIKMTLGVTYATSADQMEQALENIREILRDDPGVAQGQTILVRFTDFGDSALDIFLYYFADSADWDYYLGVRERVNLKIMRMLEGMGLEIAFPSRSVYIESMPESLTGTGGSGGIGGA
jgi:MscS family membrane protein